MRNRIKLALVLSAVAGLSTACCLPSYAGGCYAL